MNSSSTHAKNKNIQERLPHNDACTYLSVKCAHNDPIKQAGKEEEIKMKSQS